jgi:hypothetical protein
MMNARMMVILLTAGVVLSILGGGVMAGTYVYHDANGKEVRERPMPERSRSEDGGGVAGAGQRKAAERQADVAIEVKRGAPSGDQR